MHDPDPDFAFDREQLIRAVDLLGSTPASPHDGATLPAELPEDGWGGDILERLAPLVIGGAARLGAPASFAHMDPPTPWMTWATSMWTAALNQNLLHPSTAPIAREIEQRVVEWLSPFFGMDGGHMVPGSTIANLTALWAAREIASVEEVVHAETAHVSITKAARILGLRCRSVPCDRAGALLSSAVPDDLRRSVLVLTAGATSTGAVDDLSLAGRAAWTHVDAAWAGPLRLSRMHGTRLTGIEGADSVSVSAHKWLFQPKESALVFFRDTARAHDAISFGGPYLATPNVGVLGSHGAVAVPLMATLLAWGRHGVASRIETCMATADRLAAFVASNERLELLTEPQTGVVVWRPIDPELSTRLHERMPVGATSLTKLSSGIWLRNVAANPNSDLQLFEQHMHAALAGLHRE